MAKSFIDDIVFFLHCAAGILETTEKQLDGTGHQMEEGEKEPTVWMRLLFCLTLRIRVAPGLKYTEIVFGNVRLMVLKYIKIIFFYFKKIIFNIHR
jgi:hypothetical protein